MCEIFPTKLTLCLLKNNYAYIINVLLMKKSSLQHMKMFIIYRNPWANIGNGRSRNLEKGLV